MSFFLLNVIEINLLYIMVDVIGFKYLVINVMCVKFEGLVVDLVECIIEFCCIVFKDVGFLIFEIFDVILVGG